MKFDFKKKLYYEYIISYKSVRIINTVLDIYETRIVQIF